VRLLVTRPEPDGERTAAILRTRGHEVLLAPMFRVVPIRDAMLGQGPWSCVLMTSANAARAIAIHSRRAEIVRLPVLAVGRHSAAAALEAGFSVVHSADGDAGDLVRFVRGHFRQEERPLLYLAGEDRARDIAGDLERGGLAVEVAVVYRAEAVGVFPPAAAAALSAGQVEGVLHYSRRSAKAYLACAEAARLREAALAPVHYCLSAQVAEPLAEAANLRIAPQPQEEALLGLFHSD
jgi:uroporphyrinogen-III synthase